MKGAVNVLRELKEFAAARAPIQLCRTCALPADLLAAVREGHAQGIGFRMLSAFLQSKGLNVSRGSLRSHWEKHEETAR